MRLLAKFWQDSWNVFSSAGGLLFQVFAGRYEPGSILIASNNPNETWMKQIARNIIIDWLDQLILFGEASLQRALDNYIEHFHAERPHQGKGNLILFPTHPAESNSNPTRAGPVECKRRLGGLLKFYCRKAA